MLSSFARPVLIEESRSDKRHGTGNDALQPNDRVDGPRGSDDIDPELIKLPRKRTQLTPIASLSLAILCAFFFYRLLPDCLYSFEADAPTPIDIKDVSEQQIGTFIRVDAPLDFSQPVLVKKAKSKLGRRIVRFIGGENKVWAALSGDVWMEGNPQSHFAGRVRLFKNAAFLDPLKKYMESHAAMRVVGIEEFKKIINGDDKVALDIHGDPLSFSSESRVFIDYQLTNAIVINAARTDDYLEERMWRTALHQLGLVELDTSPIDSNLSGWTYKIKTRQSVAEINDRLKGEKIFGALAEPLKESITTKIADITLHDQAELLIKNKELLSTNELQSVAIETSEEINENDYVLVWGDYPSAHGRARWASVFLVLAFLVLMWNFFREVKDRL